MTVTRFYIMNKSQIIIFCLIKDLTRLIFIKNINKAIPCFHQQQKVRTQTRGL